MPTSARTERSLDVELSRRAQFMSGSHQLTSAQALSFNDDERRCACWRWSPCAVTRRRKRAFFRELSRRGDDRSLT